MDPKQNRLTEQEVADHALTVELATADERRRLEEQRDTINAALRLLEPVKTATPKPPEQVRPPAPRMSNHEPLGKGASIILAGIATLFVALVLSNLLHKNDPAPDFSKLPGPDHTNDPKPSEVEAAKQPVSPYTYYLSSFGIRQACRNLIQNKYNDHDLSFQHADLEEPQRDGPRTFWKSWFKSPKNGDTLVFSCLHNEETDRIDFKIVDRIEVP